jgi:NAD(P)-dependent dehydrogenase (short-subunit alcohol dehydrogenase family)
VAADNLNVALHYSNSKKAAIKLADQLKSNGAKVEIFQADLTQKGSAEDLVKNVTGELGAIEILINNAGLMSDESITKMSDELWDEAINLNLSVAFKLIRATADQMVLNKWGRIINVSSQVALTGSANHAHYAAAKAGLLGLTYSAAKEFGASGVTVNAVLPGRIETNMIAQRSVGRMDEWLKQTPLARLGKAEEIASMIAFLVSEKASYVTGAAINVNGGLVMG